jgi:hypothetical protein
MADLSYMIGSLLAILQTVFVQFCLETPSIESAISTLYEVYASTEDLQKAMIRNAYQAAVLHGISLADVLVQLNAAIRDVVKKKKSEQDKQKRMTDIQEHPAKPTEDQNEIDRLGHEIDRLRDDIGHITAETISLVTETIVRLLPADQPRFTTLEELKMVVQQLKDHHDHEQESRLAQMGYDASKAIDGREADGKESEKIIFAMLERCLEKLRTQFPDYRFYLETNLNINNKKGPCFCTKSLGIGDSQIPKSEQPKAELDAVILVEKEGTLQILTVIEVKSSAHGLVSDTRKKDNLKALLLRKRETVLKNPGWILIDGVKRHLLLSEEDLDFSVINLAYNCNISKLIRKILENTLTQMTYHADTFSKEKLEEQIAERLSAGCVDGIKDWLDGQFRTTLQHSLEAVPPMDVIPWFYAVLKDPLFYVKS